MSMRPGQAKGPSVSIGGSGSGGGGFLAPVLSFYDPTGGLPVTPSTGDRYLSSATANGWTEGYIYTWNGIEWRETVTTIGMVVYVISLEQLFACVNSRTVDLIGEWKGDGNALDTSGNGNNGTWTGVENYAPGVSGQAFSFDGSSGVSAGTSALFNLDPAGTYTFKAIIKLNSVGGSDTQVVMVGNAA